MSNGESTTVKLGGLEGIKPSKVDAPADTPKKHIVFSYLEVADRFIEEYEFVVEIDGVHVATLRFVIG